MYMLRAKLEAEKMQMLMKKHFKNPRNKRSVKKDSDVSKRNCIRNTDRRGRYVQLMPFLASLFTTDVGADSTNRQGIPGARGRKY